MKQIFILLLLFSVTSFVKVQSQSVESLIESEEFEEASLVLKEKIKAGPVLVRDILLLGKIYEGLGFNKKAIKIYLYGIRKLHSSSWKQIKNYHSLIEALPELKKPSQEALLLAYKVAVHYYDLYLTSESTEEFNQRVLGTSLKYFTICKYFDFNLPKIYYYLGLVFKEYEDFGKASTSFLKSWELFDRQPQKDIKRDQKIRLMVGESFVNYGHVDAGTAYLRDIFFERDVNRYLKNYAAEYLDEFLGTSVGGSFGFMVGNDSNVLLGNSIGSETLKSSSYTSKSGTLFLGHAPSYSSTYNFSLSFSEELLTESQLKDNDSRSLTFTSSLDYKKLKYSILSVSYYLSKSYIRPSSTEEFDPDSTSHQFNFSWKKILRKSTFTFILPFTRTIYQTGSQNDTKGIGFEYSDLNFNPYWNPTYSVFITSQEEGEGFDDSRNTLLSFSNSMTFGNNLVGSIDLSLEFNSNSDDSLSYLERILGFSLYYSIEKVDGLGLELNISSEANTPSSGAQDTRLKTGLGVNYLL